MPDLGNSLVPVAASFVANSTIATRSIRPSDHPITIEVIEPAETNTPNTNFFIEDQYRIPRRPPPTEKPKVHRLSKKKAKVLAEKQAKRDLKIKKKTPPRNKRFCKLCNVSCNGSKTFYDHINSRSHRVRQENKRQKPYCKICERLFESHGHLERHLNGSAHLKVVLKNKSS